MKERIRVTVNKIERLHLQIQNQKEAFNTRFPVEQMVQEKLEAHLKNSYEQEFKKTKDRQIKKLKKLIENKQNDEQTNPETNAKWVQNLLQRPLTKMKTRVLARGLNFFTPEKIQYEDYILSTELACQKIQDQGKKAELRNTIAGILKSARLPKSNITKRTTTSNKFTQKGQINRHHTGW